MMKIWGITDTGLVRKKNQDAYAFVEKTTSDHSVCVVCDGMGGTAGGELASKLAVETFLLQMEQILTPDMTPEQLREASSYAVSIANKSIQEMAQSIEVYRHMGTTLVSAVSFAEGAVVINIGDSRAYHITHSDIVQITKDHSLVESMLDRGDITAAEARNHPNRNLITRALGADTDATCDGYICPMQAGEFLLLCTDGLVNTVTDQEILFEIVHGDDIETCLPRLLEISKRRGASDNVTVVLMQKL